MSYQVFARKYRPQTFDDVLGQDHVVQTLRNAIEQNRLAHAYLFVGPRGTGKTSTARIFAKALNCPNGPAVSFDPLHPTCQEIAEGRSLDVLEIDGASNNSVDQIRELRENVQFMPTSGQFRIFYIDEVHMLTKQAFNALLKTLEEPPAHAKFIFATTEAHKILPTILSRCQRFDLRPLTTEVIAQHLLHIAQQEGVSLSTGAAYAVAKAADGGMRDAQSMLDQLVSFCGSSIEEAQVLDIFGIVSQEVVYEVILYMLTRQISPLLQLIYTQAELGRDLSQFLGEILSGLRELLISQVDATVELPSLGSQNQEALARAVGRVDTAKLLRLIEILAESEEKMKWASNKRLHLELGLIKGAHSLSQAGISDIIRALDGAPLTYVDEPRPLVPGIAPVLLPASFSASESPVLEQKLPELQPSELSPSLETEREGVSPSPEEAPEALGVSEAVGQENHSPVLEEALGVESLPEGDEESLVEETSQEVNDGLETLSAGEEPAPAESSFPDPNEREGELSAPCEDLGEPSASFALEEKGEEILPILPSGQRTEASLEVEPVLEREVRAEEPLLSPDLEPEETLFSTPVANNLSQGHELDLFGLEMGKGGVGLLEDDLFGQATLPVFEKKEKGEIELSSLPIIQEETVSLLAESEEKLPLEEVELPVLEEVLEPQLEASLVFEEPTLPESEEPSSGLWVEIPSPKAKVGWDLQKPVQPHFEEEGEELGEPKGEENSSGREDLGTGDLFAAMGLNVFTPVLTPLTPEPTPLSLNGPELWQTCLDSLAEKFPLKYCSIEHTQFMSFNETTFVVGCHPHDLMAYTHLSTAPLKEVVEEFLKQQTGQKLSLSLERTESVPMPEEVELVPLDLYAPKVAEPEAQAPLHVETEQSEAQKEAEVARKEEEKAQALEDFYQDPLIQDALEIFEAKIVE